VLDGILLDGVFFLYIFKGDVMKKVVFGFLLLFGSISNSMAGPAPDASYWDVRYITSSDYYPAWEPMWNKYSTEENHGGGWIAIYVLVVGYTNSIYAGFGGSTMEVFDTVPIDFDGDRIIDGWWYIYLYTGPMSSGQIIVKDIYNNRYGTQDWISVR
jgi:hypothetical protein